MSNVLDKYRDAARQDDRKRPEVREEKGEEYKAFKAGTASIRRFDVRPNRDAWQLISYADITHVIHAAGIGLTIVTRYAVIDIEGRNLQTLVESLQTESVVWVRQYSPRKHRKPQESAPFIKNLTIHDKVTGNTAVPDQAPTRH